MRTYGIDQNTGKWTLLTQTPITGAGNPTITVVNSVLNQQLTVTSTLYNALIGFSDGSSTVNNNDILLNDVVKNFLGQTISNVWQDITQGFTLTSAPSNNNIALQQGGFISFLADYGLNRGEEVIVDAGYIWLATLAQTLRLNTKESPFYANYGISAEQSVQSQIAPTVDITRTQSQFAPYFSSLTIYKQPNTANPTYNISAVFLNGTTVQSVIAT